MRERMASGPMHAKKKCRRPRLPPGAGFGVGVPAVTFVKSGPKQVPGALSGVFFARRRSKKRLGASWGPSPRRAGGDLGVVGVGVLLLGDGVQAARGRAAEPQPLQAHDVEGLRRGRLVGGEVGNGAGSRGGGHGSERCVAQWRASRGRS